MIHRTKRKLEYLDYSVKKKKLKHNNNDADEECDEEEEVDVPQMILINSAHRGDGSEIDRDDHKIWFNCSVNNKTVNSLIKELHDINKEFEKAYHNHAHTGKLVPKPIQLFINSPGGNLIEAMAAIDAIQQSKIEVHTIVQGSAASAATLMSIVGKKRYITKNSMMLIHELSSAMWGKMSEIKDDYRNCQFFMKRIKELYMENTKMTEENLDSILTHDLYWDANTCMEHGLVDEIYA